MSFEVRGFRVFPRDVENIKKIKQGTGLNGTSETIRFALAQTAKKVGQ